MRFLRWLTYLFFGVLGLRPDAVCEVCGAGLYLSRELDEEMRGWTIWEFEKAHRGCK